MSGRSEKILRAALGERYITPQKRILKATEENTEVVPAKKSPPRPADIAHAVSRHILSDVTNNNLEPINKFCNAPLPQGVNKFCNAPLPQGVNKFCNAPLPQGVNHLPSPGNGGNSNSNLRQEHETSQSARKELFSDPYLYPDDSSSNISQPIPYVSRLSELEVEIIDENGVDYQIQSQENAENEIANTNGIAVDSTDLSNDSLSMKVDALAEARDLIKYINNKEMSQMAAIFDESRKFSDEDLEDLQNKQNKLDGLLDILLTKEEQENCESVVKAIVDNVPKLSTDNSRPFAQFHNDRNYEEVAVEVDQSDVIDPVWNILPQDQLNSKFCIDAIRELQKKSGT
ncbi:unnamed protein product [Bemisia tabaci]|uniref:Uncharacterized protein n=1 Tax=Bemisia tabaci TaxID=7038 RepID=A0A9P0C720_BEMTA|nr:unnamed protein product [Bemisia tabaci]